MVLLQDNLVMWTQRLDSCITSSFLRQLKWVYFNAKNPIQDHWGPDHKSMANSLGCTRWNQNKPIQVKSVNMINWVHFRRPDVPMHGSLVVSMVEKLIPSSHIIIFANLIIIDGEPICNHPCRIPHNWSVFKEVLPYDFLCPSTSHLVLLKVKSFL